MNSQNLKPAYEVKEVATNSSSPPWSNIDNICQDIQNGWIVLWQYHAVFTGQVESGKVQWLTNTNPEADDKHLVRIRAFNASKEYHFWKSGQKIKGRLRTDGAGEPVEYIQTEMVLRSIVATPLKKASFELSEGTLAIVTRNYIGYHPETHQAGYVDSRFVDFEPKI